MGAGKTVLIGAIIASEFALALEYHPDGPGPFIQNALVFAPWPDDSGKPARAGPDRHEPIIPPRLHRAFDASLQADLHPATASATCR
jgi:type III restriction enzyme